jgi:hypothetical protein
MSTKYLGVPGWYVCKDDFGSEIYHLCQRGTGLTLVEKELDIYPLGGKVCQCGASIKFVEDSIGVIYPILCSTKSSPKKTTMTLREAADLLGISKQATQKAARVEQWAIADKVGNVHLYYKADVLVYRDHRYRTQLAKALGWRGRGLYREGSNIDIECPACGAFAIDQFGKSLCLEGHIIVDYSS